VRNVADVRTVLCRLRALHRASGGLPMWARFDTLAAMPVAVHIVEHPLIADALTRVRDAATPNALFRQELERIGTLLIAEATRSLSTVPVRVRTPLVETDGQALASQPVVVPVLRAGLGFVHAAQELLPNADVGFIGVSRDEATFRPKPYVNKLPEQIAGRQVIVLDPMLATGGSLAHTCQLLVEHGATGTIVVVCVLAAPEGIRLLEDAGLDLAIFTASVDERLNDNAFIVPGLGDAGDRQFGSPASN
jgi:uracil phosphoribosyltransferase